MDVSCVLVANEPRRAFKTPKKTLTSRLLRKISFRPNFFCTKVAAHVRKCCEVLKEAIRTKYSNSDICSNRNNNNDDSDYNVIV